jgi:phosphoribosylformimino-5-aminoimidazole carboxamide ribotide isomerase
LVPSCIVAIAPRWPHHHAGPGTKAALSALRAYQADYVGGGIRPDNAMRYLQNGASHVIVTSYAFHQGH